MESEALFRARIRALEGALSKAWPAEGDDTPPAEDGRAADAVAGDLYREAGDRVRTMVESLERQVISLERAVEAGQPLDSCWRGYDAVVLASEPAMEEALLVRQGALARAAGLDCGICRIADCLISEICGRTGVDWRRFTIVASGEAYTHLTNVVRLRFPDLSVWDLPAAAHELGHHAALRLERPTAGRPSFPFREVVAARDDREPEAHLEEYFADAFAALTLGAAYACTCLLTRFDPAAGSDDAHPSDRDRAAAILVVLRRAAADATVGKEALGAQIDHVERLWTDACAAVGVDGHAAGDAVRAVAELTYARLRDALPKSARWSAEDQQRAKLLATRLADPNYEPGGEGATGAMNVVAAGWAARLAAGADATVAARVTGNVRAALDAMTGVAA